MIGTLISAIAAALELIAAVYANIEANKQKDEGSLATFARLASDEAETIKAAKAARDAAAARDATDAGLRQSDGFQRD